MTSIARTSMPVVTITRLELGPDETISARDFLRGLKRPIPFDPQISTAPEIASSDPGTVNPLVSLSTETIITKETEPPGLDCAKILLMNRLDDGCEESIKAPKVTRTYKKARKQISSWHDPTRDTSPLFCFDEFNGTNDDIERSPQIHQVGESIGSSASKIRRRSIRSVGVKAAEDSRYGLNEASRGQQLEPANSPRCERREGRKQKTSKVKTNANTEKKRRRAPVKELVLVPGLPSGPNSPTSGRNSETLEKLDYELLGEDSDPLDCSPPRVVHSKRSEFSNGKPVTKIRRYLSIPQQHNISHKDFKFPPVTPGPRRNPNQKLGSGFAGVGSRRMQGRKPRKPHKYPQGTLELSDVLSPTLRANRAQPVQNCENPSVDSIEIGSTLVDHSKKGLNVDRKAIQASSEELYGESREVSPSARIVKSIEHNTSTGFQDSEAEGGLFGADDGSRDNGKNVSKSGASEHHVIQDSERETIRNGKIEENSANHQISQSRSSPSVQFAGMTQKVNPLDTAIAPTSQAKTLHPTMITPGRDAGIRKAQLAIFHSQRSHLPGTLFGQSLRRCNTEKGILDLEITPRLKRTMSNLPFRPPFKPLV